MLYGGIFLYFYSGSVKDSFKDIHTITKNDQHYIRLYFNLVKKQL